MGTVESLQQQVRALTPDELAQFRTWLLDLDWADWDARLDDDIRAGRLEALAEQALHEHASGETTRL
jgi:hypothetical protein